ncbi:SprB repeat-containing protein [Catalinimonas niigatensis]|uniref:SprB repeat-containing protein n=1 Tax=Catalinimonas niigatensis TaxID=1397264 RepID=UPI0026669F72|nr:SprB repeat-containing protein [Catalinimonas niigatensis]WPP49331.1 SprB repeat-containing protein [Catalinimonas niigatensis]
MKSFHYFLLLFLSGLLLSCGEDEETATCPDNFIISTSEVIDASCEVANGSMRLTSSGAQGAVSYQLDGGTSQTDDTFLGLGPGTYQVSAEDAEGCTTSLTVTVGNIETEINAQVSTTSSECGETEGSIVIDASGGTAPYSYSLDGENFQSENEFSALTSGNYTLTVKDANGCTTELTANVNSGISFSARISDIISTNCAVSGCHVAGTGRLNFNEKSNILDNANTIKSRTGSKVMPPPDSGRSLSDDQIQAIACWVDDGAIDN